MREDLHLVVGPGKDGKPVRFRVCGWMVPHPERTPVVDVAPDGSGAVREPRLYQFIRQKGPVRDRTFQIEFLDPGVQAVLVHLRLSRSRGVTAPQCHGLTGERRTRTVVKEPVERAVAGTGAMLSATSHAAAVKTQEIQNAVHGRRVVDAAAPPESIRRA